MSSLTVTLLSLGSLVSMSRASININTLPPDLRRLEFLDSVPPRSTINPVWSGEYSAALDGEQNRVLVSWTVLGPEDGVDLQSEDAPGCRAAGQWEQALRSIEEVENNNENGHSDS